MRKVVTTALGIPLQIAFQPLQAQEKAISAQLDITKFKDPKFVESFVQRYLLAAQRQRHDTKHYDTRPILACRTGPGPRRLI